MNEERNYIRTIHLALIVKGENKKESWKRIRDIQHDTWRAANTIINGQFLNDQLMRSTYERLGIDPKDLKAVSEAEEKFNSFFGVKRQATSERDIKAAYPSLPPCVTNTLNQIIVSNYKSDKKDVLSGKRSLRTYRREIPIPTSKVSVVFSEDEKGYSLTWKLGRDERIECAIFFGRDKANYRETVRRIMDGTYDYGAPSFMIEDNKLFLYLPVKEPVKSDTLRADLCVGVDLGLSVPAYCALSEGYERLAIGSMQDFLRVRMQMQARKRNLQKSLKLVKGGKGRAEKLKALDRIEEKEGNFALQYNHAVSKQIVDFALKHGAGVIKIEMLEGFGKEERNSFVLRNWSYFQLQNQIKYKAARHGIIVITVDPYHTSQTCSKCGHYEPGQRKSQSEFECASCGEKIQADYNAALNIARSMEVVTKREECQYFKKHSKETEDVA